LNGGACAGNKSDRRETIPIIMVGFNIILSCGKEYVKFAWEFGCKPGQENLDFLRLKKIEMTQKTKNIPCILERHW
jgi:hypothetical protein